MTTPTILLPENAEYTFGTGAPATILSPENAILSDAGGASGETAAVGLAIGKMAFNVAAADLPADHASASISVASPGIAVHATDLASVAKLRQFNTFG